MLADLAKRPADSVGYALCALAALCGVALATAGLLEGYPYWADEAFSLGAAAAPLGESLHSHILLDVHPPFYYLALSLWLEAFGSGEVATRSLSYLGALGALGLLWGMGRGRYSTLTLAIATAWLAAHWLWVMYAQETRTYALTLAGAAWLSLAFARHWAAPAPPSRKSLAFFACGALLFAGLHYYAMLMAGVALALLSWKARRDAPALALPAVVLCVCVAWLSFNFLGMWLSFNFLGTWLWFGETVVDWNSRIIPRIIGDTRASIREIFGWSFPQLHWLLIRTGDAVDAPPKVAAVLGTGILGAYAWWLARAPRHPPPASSPPRQGEELVALRGLLVLVGAVLPLVLLLRSLLPHPFMKGIVVFLPALALVLGVLVRQSLSGGWRVAAIALLLGSSLGVTAEWECEESPSIRHWLRPSPMQEREYVRARQWRDETGRGANMHFIWGLRKATDPAWLGAFRFYHNGGTQPLMQVRHEDVAHLVPPYFIVSYAFWGGAWDIAERALRRGRPGQALKSTPFTDVSEEDVEAIYLVEPAG